MQPFCPQVAALETQLQKILLEAKQMEDAAMASLGEQMATEKGTHATAQATEKLRLVVQDKEMAAAQLQNELARLKVDALNTVSHNAQLQAQLKATNAELVEKDALMAKCEPLHDSPPPPSTSPPRPPHSTPPSSTSPLGTRQRPSDATCTSRKRRTTSTCSTGSSTSS